MSASGTKADVIDAGTTPKPFKSAYFPIACRDIAGRLARSLDAAIEGPGQTSAGFAISNGRTLVLPLADSRCVRDLPGFRASLPATDLADDGVEGRREQEPERGHSQHAGEDGRAQ